MKRRRFSVEQITTVLQQAESGVPIGDLCRQAGISEQSFYRWWKVYGHLEPSEARELKQLGDENTNLDHQAPAASGDQPGGPFDARADSGPSRTRCGVSQGPAAHTPDTP